MACWCYVHTESSLKQRKKRSANFPCKDLQSIHEHRQFVLASTENVRREKITSNRLEYNFAKTLIMHYSLLQQHSRLTVIHNLRL